MRTSPPLALTESKSVVLPGTRSMSPNEVKMTFGPRGDFERLVDHFERRHAHRTARSVNERDLFRQQFINAELHDGVRLAAADFHDVPRPRRDAVDFRAPIAAHSSAVAIFVQKFHGRRPSFNSPSSSICFRYSKTLCASSSSTRLKAKPTCTMT